MTESPKPEAESAPAPTATPATKRESMSVIIRPWPKVIFLYPTLLMAVGCWLYTLIAGDGFGAQAMPTDAAATGEAEAAAGASGSNVGNVFMAVFFLNLLVFSFDFSRIKSITILIALAAGGFGLAWADDRWGVAGNLMGALSLIDIQMNSQFYGWMAAFLFVCLLLVLVNTRFNYYEINHREILHHHGYLGDITRVPTQGLRFNKEIYDLMEFVLLRSGRLIFVTPTAHEAIVIDNVPNVNRAEDRIKNLLSVVAVRMG
ncbi:MAG: hypothetical protein KDB80_08165 [Planctomycetes bacterium]|nr:hypothetical protein [Planctomycetota bacterium]